MNKVLKNALILSSAFVIWTLMVMIIDVKPIGPQGTNVGLAALNGWFHELTGVHMGLYELTDYLELIAIAICLGFAALGCYQWIKRKALLKVDSDIIILGLFYIAVIAAYVFFNAIHLNYRPVLIEGELEPSYPSSTTLLIWSVMITAIIQCTNRLKGKLRGVLNCTMIAFSIFLIIGRTISGVHWLSDIVGSLLLSAALILWYVFAVRKVKEIKKEKGKA